MFLIYMLVGRMTMGWWLVGGNDPTTIQIYDLVYDSIIQYNLIPYIITW